jgi:hypothetical protein
MGPFNLARNLANTLGDGAEYAHFTGNDPEALERVRDIFHVARSCRADDTVVGQLVGIGIDALATSATLAIAPGLRVEPGDANAPATRAAAQALIAELLDDDPIRRGIQRSFVFERALTHETRTIAASRTWVIRPLADAQLLRDDHNFEIEIAAAVLQNKPQVMAALARTTAEHALERGAITPKQYRDVPRYSRWFGSAWYFDRYFETSFRVRAERRIAAVSLAAQLFRGDHRRWPTTLDELVPQYLPAVPTDPFTDGAPLGYVVKPGALPDGGDRPLVFCRSGEIDYGPYPEPSYGWESDRRPGVKIRQDLWQYRDLARFSPATQPASTQAVDDQP